MSKVRKVQTNLKLSPARAAALNLAAAIEHKDKAQIVEEALQLREELMGKEYSAMIQAALQVRFSDDPEERLTAIASLRDEIDGATPDSSVSVDAAIARIRGHAGNRPPA